MSIFKTHRAALRSGVLATLLAFGVASPAAFAQDLTVGWNPRSGDVWVDTWLGDVNRYGYQYREPFIDELVRYHHAPRTLVVELIDRRHWAPGDVYYACALASIIGRPCRYVVDYYEANRGQGWGVTAQRLGIKPGSPEFHRLKKGFVPTYDRWARPIDLDDELHRAYPDRGKGAKGGKAVAGGKVSGKQAGAQGGAGKGKAAGQAASGHGQGKGGGPSGKGQGGQKGGKPSDKGGGKGNGKG